MVIYLTNNFAIKGNTENKFDVYKKHYDLNIKKFVWCYCDTVETYTIADEIAFSNKDYPLMFKGMETLEDE